MPTRQTLLAFTFVEFVVRHPTWSWLTFRQDPWFSRIFTPFSCLAGYLCWPVWIESKQLKKEGESGCIQRCVDVVLTPPLSLREWSFSTSLVMTEKHKTLMLSYLDIPSLTSQSYANFRPLVCLLQCPLIFDKKSSPNCSHSEILQIMNHTSLGRSWLNLLLFGFLPVTNMEIKTIGSARAVAGWPGVCWHIWFHRVSWGEDWTIKVKSQTTTKHPVDSSALWNLVPLRLQPVSSAYNSARAVYIYNKTWKPSHFTIDILIYSMQARHWKKEAC